MATPPSRQAWDPRNRSAAPLSETHAGALHLFPSEEEPRARRVTSSPEMTGVAALGDFLAESVAVGMPAADAGSDAASSRCRTDRTAARGARRADHTATVSVAEPQRKPAPAALPERPLFEHVSPHARWPVRALCVVLLALPFAGFAAARSGLLQPLLESPVSSRPSPPAGERLPDSQPEPVTPTQEATTAASAVAETPGGESAPAPAGRRRPAPVSPAVGTQAGNANAVARTAPVAPGTTGNPTSPPDRPRFQGTLSVESDVESAQVYVDGNLVGVTPLASWVVPAGSHVVRVEHEGYERWSTVVQVVAGNGVTLVATLSPRK